MRLPPDQQAIRTGCFHPTGAFVEFAQDETEQSISQRFEKIVRLHPERLALRAQGRSLTYEALNQAANRIARSVLRQNEQPGQPVALLLEKGILLTVAILGALKAGKLYVLLNTSFPIDRIRFMLENSQSTLLITNNEYLSLARDLAPREILLNADELDADLSIQNPHIFRSPDDLAWIHYTSGSTGQPKGVVQNHRNLLDLAMQQTNDFHVCSDDRLTTITSQGGDMFLALLNGAALFPVEMKHEGLAGLGDWLIREKITVYSSVPSVFRHFVSGLRGDQTFSDLRLIRLTGEPVYRRDVELYRDHFGPNCILVNRLSSNEVPTFRQYFINHETIIADEVVPVGYAVEGKEVMLLSEDGTEVKVNEPGEIVVKSRHVALGYWRNPALTQSRFAPVWDGSDCRTYRTGDLGCMGADGCLVYLGRKDFQVKIRGNRVELAEIERALLSLGGLDEAVVLALKDADEEQRLVAYIVPRGGTPVMTGTLRHSLSEKLPSYMIPSNFVVLDSLPLTATGKVDRNALPMPVMVRAELDAPFTAPGTPLESNVASIWAETLGLDRVGIYDKFFDLGGHSLAAMRIVLRVMKTFRLELPVRALFESPTVADMALIVAQNQAKNAGEVKFADLMRELEAMSEEEARNVLGKNPAREIEK